jgi:glucose dehydrogenase
MRYLFAIGLLLGSLGTLFGQARQVDDSALKNAGRSTSDGDWLTYGLTPGETRFSPLKMIDASNVKRLGLVWSYEMGEGGGDQEATPLVWNNTIFGVTNWSVVFALDARTGKEKWRWDPLVNRNPTRDKMCCGVVNRGLALYRNKIYVPVNDGRLQALDAETGKPVWEARVAWVQNEQTLTIAPRIAKGKVIVGAAGGDRPTRGFFAAYDAEPAAKCGSFTRFQVTRRRALNLQRCARPPQPGTATGGNSVEAARCGTAYRTIPRPSWYMSAQAMPSRGLPLFALKT